ncbi:MAG: site-specific DNA-methyltransferase [Candidatus Moraniibacteriota bacterium]
MLKKEKELLDRIFDLEGQIKKLKDRKRYGLVWEEKVEKFETESQNALPILREKGGKFPDLITDEKQDFNILIEGDNFHALSVLAYTHQNKVDVIYIDPPYNTGNKDFRYNDNFILKENSYRHSSWLSFMAKRLKLAKSLLSKNGVVFISIDDNEQANLKLLCDEIFGEENFIANTIWRKKYGGGKGTRFFVDLHEYIVVYSKNINYIEPFLLERSSNQTQIFKEKDEYYKERGFYYIRPLKSGLALRKTLIYPIKCPDGSEVKTQWICGKDTFENILKDGRIVFKKLKNGKYNIYKKFYEKDGDGLVHPESIFYDLAYNQNGKEELKDIFNIKEGREIPFENPKPTKLINYLLSINENKNATILDFMAGSGTTGHAVLKFNSENKTAHKFILCTNNENKICEDITYERIKRVSLGYENPKGEKVAGLGGNLKYLKTDFVPLEKSADSLKQKIVEGSTEIICLKENVFDLVCDNYAKTKSKIFQNQHKFVAILFDLFYFEEFVLELKKLKEKPVSVYVFSYTKDFSKDEFGDLGVDFSVEPIPEKILETYKKIFNF